MSVMTRIGAQSLGQCMATTQVSNVDRTANEIIQMDVDEIRRLRGDNRWRVIICRKGRIWVTQEHDWRDYVLEPGDIFVITQLGQVLIEALHGSSAEITPPVRSASYSGPLPVFA